MIPGKRKNFEDLTGQVFGDLTVVKYVGRKGTPSGSFKSEWLCICSCGAEKLATTPRLRSGDTNSCGCKTKEKMAAANARHGLSKFPEYNSWTGLRERCRNPANKDWPNYGGRGITVCERWEDFENFMSDMGRRPGPKYSIERLDTNGPYAPGNCRWATAKEQCNNKRNTRVITAFGESKPITEWAERLGVTTAVIYGRIDRFGWPPEKAVSVPAAHRKPRSPA